MRKRVALLALPLLVAGLLTGCTPHERTTTTKTCTPPPALTTTNNIRQGGTVTVYSAGADCGVRFTNDDRQITVALVSNVANSKVYARQTLIAGTDGQYRVRLRVPKTMPAGVAVVGVTKGIKISCDGNANCPSLARQVTILPSNGYPQASFDAQRSASPKP